MDIKGDTRSLDYSSHGELSLLRGLGLQGFRVEGFGLKV